MFEKECTILFMIRRDQLLIVYCYYGYREYEYKYGGGSRSPFTIYRYAFAVQLYSDLLVIYNKIY